MRVKIEKLEENVPWKMEDCSVRGIKKLTGIEELGKYKQVKTSLHWVKRRRKFCRC